ncbi:hypothetical protein ABKN59_005091 [Abortiporus biennis]
MSPTALNKRTNSDDAVYRLHKRARHSYQLPSGGERYNVRIRGDGADSIRQSYDNDRLKEHCAQWRHETNAPTYPARNFSLSISGNRNLHSQEACVSGTVAASSALTSPLALKNCCNPSTPRHSWNAKGYNDRSPPSHPPLAPSSVSPATQMNSLSIATDDHPLMDTIRAGSFASQGIYYDYTRQQQPPMFGHPQYNMPSEYSNWGFPIQIPSDMPNNSPCNPVFSSPATTVPSLSRESSSSPASMTELLTPSDALAIHPQVFDVLVNPLQDLRMPSLDASGQCVLQQAFSGANNMVTPNLSPNMNNYNMCQPSSSILPPFQVPSMVLGANHPYSSAATSPTTVAPAALSISTSEPHRAFVSPTPDPVLHQPRPHRLYVPRWQCDPDFDLEQFTPPNKPPQANSEDLRQDLNPIHNFHPSDDLDPDFEAELLEDEDDFMDEDTFEGSSGEHFTHNDGRDSTEFEGIEVGPTMGLGLQRGSLDAHSLLFQPVPDSVKYSAFSKY